MSDLKAELHDKLREKRAELLAKLDGLSEYDVRRPLVPSGTNLLGLVKHLIGNEQVYLGTALGRPTPFVLPWVEDGSIWDGADMWARPEETREHLLDLYAQVNRHGDATIAALDLDAPASVPHWPEDRRATTFGFLLIRMVAETAHHAGHADICRELIDGQGPPDADDYGDAEHWAAYTAGVQAAAEAFRTP